MLFIINVTHLHEISPIYWIFNHRCGYWWWFSTMESVGHSAELFKGWWHIEGALVLNEVRNVAIVNTNVNQFKAFYVNCNNLEIGTEAMESRRYTTRMVIFTQIPSSLQYKTHQIPTLKIVLYCLAAIFAESLEARCLVDHSDVVGAAPTGDATTTSEWSTILLPTKVRLILEVLRYVHM